ncbi:SDR family NAD(P)-dependent oxidoreductase [Metabacillus endolithicus]|uniref:SDR family NAD(P)-dependent oxidoreductase n=1 Tax=Metabacillus endolithicus TaxID=1535204 RepID=A0ABW5BTD4_9BACI|nr:glucose 1-dehydrogenase [Metabacillus endolithicus]UPG62850.1 glucose 1-dehydrogenase [Metabacillus endolithicus]
MYLPSFNLSNKTAVITGAGRGIGRALAIGFAEAGANLVLLSRTEKELNEVETIISDMGRTALPIVTDVTKPSDISEAIEKIKQENIKIDILVNNAGMNIRTEALNVTEDEWDKIMNTNIKSAFFMSREIGALMKEHGEGGRIINISSVAGKIALRTGVAYGATKAAMIQMTKILAFEWGKYHINVNSIGPWYFETPLTKELLSNEEYVKDILAVTPLKRIGQLPELVGPAVFLASDASSYISGQTLFVDGGMTINGF